MNIESDFLGDWHHMVLHELQQIDSTVDPAADPSDLCIRYVNWRRRQVPKGPRTVHVAPELQCPAALSGGFEALKDKIQRGDDLTAHLSIRLDDLEFDDGLLNDWGIYHLHLGTTPHPTKPAFVKRTGDVLMARFDNQNAYLIEIVPHQQWTRKRLLEIVHRQWPNTIAQYRVPGRPTQTFTEKQYAQLRKAGVLTMIELDGVGYQPLGGGSATSGVSVYVVNTCNRIIDSLRDYEAQLKAKATEVAEEFRSHVEADKGHAVSMGDILALRMQTDGETVWAVSRDLDATMRLGPLVR